MVFSSSFARCPLPALAGRHNDDDVISLARRTVNNPNPAMKQKGVSRVTLFFSRVAKSAGVSPPQALRDREREPCDSDDAACTVGGGSPAFGAALARH